MYFYGSSVLGNINHTTKMLEDLKNQLGVCQETLNLLQQDQLHLEKQIVHRENAIQIYTDHFVKHRMAYPNTMQLLGRIG